MRNDLSVREPTILPLKLVGQLTFYPKLPFNFRLTFWKPSHFFTGLEAHTEDTTWRTFRISEKTIAVRFTISNKKLSAAVFGRHKLSDDERQMLVSRIEYSYGLNESMVEFRHIATKDKVLRPMWEALEGMRVSCPESVFEIAVISLLLQNTTIKRSMQMMGNLQLRYGKRVRCDGHILKAYFTPREIRDVKEDELRQFCRLGYRAKYLPRFAEHFASCSDDVRQYADRASLVASLQEIHGVGPYTSNVVASHALRDTEAIPYDVWSRRIYAKCLFGDHDVAVKKIDREMRTRFGRFAGIAALYMVEYEYLKQPLVPLLPSTKTTSTK